MLSEHEDKPCYRVACSWTFMERQVWGWIWGTSKEDLLINIGMQETILSATEVSQYLEGPLKNPRPYFDFATCTVPFLMIPFRICISGVGHNPQHNSSGLQNEKKKKARWLMFVCVINGVTSSDMDTSTSNTLQVGVSIDLENLLWLSWLYFSFFLFWRSSFSGSQQLCHLCPKAINRKQNIGKWSKKSYLFPYRSLVSWVTVPKTQAGCSGVLSLWCCWHTSRAVS